MDYYSQITRELLLRISRAAMCRVGLAEVTAAIAGAPVLFCQTKRCPGTVQHNISSLLTCSLDESESMLKTCDGQSVCRSIALARGHIERNPCPSLLGSEDV